MFTYPYDWRYDPYNGLVLFFFILHLFSQRFEINVFVVSVAPLSFLMISIDSKVHSDTFNPGERIKWFRPHTPEEAWWVSCPTCGDSAALCLPHCLTLRRVAHFTIWAPFFTSTVSGYVQGKEGVGREGAVVGRRKGRGGEDEGWQSKGTEEGEINGNVSKRGKNKVWI